MRIVLFHQYFLGKHDAGGSRWNAFVDVFARKHGMHIDVLAGNIHYASGKRILPKRWCNREKVDERVTLYRTWTYAGYNQNFFGRALGYFSYMFSSFAKALTLPRPDVIIVTSPPLFVGLSAMLLSRIKKVPFIFEVRDLWPESAQATGVLTNRTLLRIMYKLEYALYLKSRKIVVLTPAFRDDIIKRYPQFRDKIEVITNGADFALMQRALDGSDVRKRYGWGNKRVFAYFGAHGVANGLMQIIEAAKRLQDRDDILFVLIGDGMQKKALMARAKAYGLRNVQFIDAVAKEEVGTYINAVDVAMAVLMKTKTFKTVYPNKLFDYMSCKKPVLVGIDGIAKELIEQARCGLYSEPENIAQLVGAIRTFADMDKQTLSEMGERGYIYVKAHFDRIKLAMRYAEMIQKETDEAAHNGTKA